MDNTFERMRNAPREIDKYSAASVHCGRDKLEALENKCSMTYADLDLISSDESARDRIESNRIESSRVESNRAASETRGSVEQCKTRGSERKRRGEERKGEGLM